MKSSISIYYISDANGIGVAFETNAKPLEIQEMMESYDLNDDFIEDIKAGLRGSDNDEILMSRGFLRYIKHKGFLVIPKAIGDDDIDPWLQSHGVFINHKIQKELQAPPDEPVILYDDKPFYVAMQDFQNDPIRWLDLTEETWISTWDIEPPEINESNNNTSRYLCRIFLNGQYIAIETNADPDELLKAVHEYYEDEYFKRKRFEAKTIKEENKVIISYLKSKGFQVGVHGTTTQDTLNWSKKYREESDKEVYDINYSKEFGSYWVAGKQPNKALTPIQKRHKGSIKEIREYVRTVI